MYLLVLSVSKYEPFWENSSHILVFFYKPLIVSISLNDLTSEISFTHTVGLPYLWFCFPRFQLPTASRSLEADDFLPTYSPNSVVV